MKNRLVAILLAFFLGGFGIHKFYLGRNGAGLIYLLLFWSFIPGLLGIFDAVRLALLPEHEFQFKYNKIVPDPEVVVVEKIKHIEKKNKDGVSDKIRELDGLRQEGLLTNDEFQLQKKRILEKIESSSTS